MGKRRGHAAFFNTTYCATWPNALALQKKKSGQYLQLKCRKATVLAEQGWCASEALQEKMACLPASPAPSSFHTVLQRWPKHDFPLSKTDRARALASLSWESVLCTVIVRNLSSRCRRDPLQPPGMGTQGSLLAALERDVSGKTRLLERISIYNLDPNRWLVLGVNVTKYWFLKSLKCLNREWKMKPLLACKWSFMPCAGKRRSHQYWVFAAHWTSIKPISVHEMLIIKHLHPF